MLPVNITEGDQPKDSNEVALPEDMAKQLNVGIGDTVRLTSQYAVGTDGKAKADNVRVVGLTSDPNGAYSYYGGAIVGSDNLLAAMQGTDHRNNNGIPRPCLGWKQRIRKNHQQCESVAAKAFRSDVATAGQ